MWRLLRGSSTTNTNQETPLNSSSFPCPSRLTSGEKPSFTEKPLCSATFSNDSSLKTKRKKFNWNPKTEQAKNAVKKAQAMNKSGHRIFREDENRAQTSEGLLKNVSQSKVEMVYDGRKLCDECCSQRNISTPSQQLMLQQQQQELIKERNELQNKVCLLESQKEVYTKQIKAKLTEVEKSKMDLLQKVKALESKLSGAPSPERQMAEVRALQEEKRLLTQKVHCLQTKNHRLMTELSDAHTDILNVKAKDKLKMEQEVNALAAELTKEHEHSEDLRLKVKTLEKIVCDMDFSAEQESQQLRSELNNSIGNLYRMKQMNMELVTDYENLQKYVEELQITNKQLQKKQDKVVIEMSKLVSDLQNEIQQLKAKMANQPVPQEALIIVPSEQREVAGPENDTGEEVVQGAEEVDLPPETVAEIEEPPETDAAVNEQLEESEDLAAVVALQSEPLGDEEQSESPATKENEGDATPEHNEPESKEMPGGEKAEPISEDVDLGQIQDEPIIQIQETSAPPENTNDDTEENPEMAETSAEALPGEGEGEGEDVDAAVATAAEGEIQEATAENFTEELLPPEDTDTNGQGGEIQKAASTEIAPQETGGGQPEIAASSDEKIADTSPVSVPAEAKRKRSCNCKHPCHHGRKDNAPLLDSRGKELCKCKTFIFPYNKDTSGVVYQQNCTPGSSFSDSRIGAQNVEARETSQQSGSILVEAETQRENPAQVKRTTGSSEEDSKAPTTSFKELRGRKSCPCASNKSQYKNTEKVPQPVPQNPCACSPNKNITTQIGIKITATDGKPISEIAKRRDMKETCQCSAMGKPNRRSSNFAAAQDASSKAVNVLFLKPDGTKMKPCNCLNLLDLISAGGTNSGLTQGIKSESKEVEQRNAVVTSSVGTSQKIPAGNGCVCRKENSPPESAGKVQKLSEFGENGVPAGLMTGPCECDCLIYAVLDTVQRLTALLAFKEEKCVMKDRMIQALADELNMRSTSGVFENLLTNLAKDESEFPGKPNDFDRTTLCDYLKRPTGYGGQQGPCTAPCSTEHAYSKSSAPTLERSINMETYKGGCLEAGVTSCSASSKSSEANRLPGQACEASCTKISRVGGPSTDSQRQPCESSCEEACSEITDFLAACKAACAGMQKRAIFNNIRRSSQSCDKPCKAACNTTSIDRSFSHGSNSAGVNEFRKSGTCTDSCQATCNTTNNLINLETKQKNSSNQSYQEFCQAPCATSSIIEISNDYRINTKNHVGPSENYNRNERSLSPSRCCCSSSTKGEQSMDFKSLTSDAPKVPCSNCSRKQGSEIKFTTNVKSSNLPCGDPSIMKNSTAVPCSACSGNSSLRDSTNTPGNVQKTPCKVPCTALCSNDTKREDSKYSSLPPTDVSYRDPSAKREGAEADGTLPTCDIKCISPCAENENCNANPFSDMIPPSETPCEAPCSKNVKVKQTSISENQALSSTIVEEEVPEGEGNQTIDTQCEAPCSQLGKGNNQAPGKEQTELSETSITYTSPETHTILPPDMNIPPPSDLEVIHFSDLQDILISWRPPCVEGLRGFEIYMDGRIMKKVMRTRTTALLRDVECSCNMVIKVYTLTSIARSYEAATYP